MKNNENNLNLFYTTEHAAKHTENLQSTGPGTQPNWLLPLEFSPGEPYIRAVTILARNYNIIIFFELKRMNNTFQGKKYWQGKIGIELPLLRS